MELVDYYNSIIESVPLLVKMYADGFTIPDFSQFKVIQDYVREKLEPNVNFYSNCGNRNTKTLLVCFCGVGNQIGITAASFLQRIDANRFDVVMLIDPSSSHFRNGISGFCDGLPDVIEDIQRRCFTDEYDSVYALGHSMGALVAMRYSQYARCDRSIAIAPSIMDDTVRVFLNNETVEAFDPLCACRFDQAQNPVVVHSDGNQMDGAFSRHLASVLNARLYSLANAAGHPTMLEAYRLNRAKGLLDVLLSPTLPKDILIDLPEDKVREPSLYLS